LPSLAFPRRSGPQTRRASLARATKTSSGSRSPREGLAQKSSRRRLRIEGLRRQHLPSPGDPVPLRIGGFGGKTLVLALGHRGILENGGGSRARGTTPRISRRTAIPSTGTGSENSD